MGRFKRPSGPVIGRVNAPGFFVRMPAKDIFDGPCSWTLGGEVNLRGIPLYVRLHRGPMNTLSNYTQRQDSIGFGFRFAGL